ncbi:uncharacterized protein PAC_11736 [Phialocephala subalpina]|uniref:Uncharacterized protein n=1 Tax=Phialocephala subalpina TaxID=576137 RepID=A0A1L7X9Z2_9HELO|nr:uncharacterized protein PAC_11736 [Phialocephala subalpina]
MSRKREAPSLSSILQDLPSERNSTDSSSIIAQLSLWQIPLKSGGLKALGRPSDLQPTSLTYSKLYLETPPPTRPSKLSSSTTRPPPPLALYTTVSDHQEDHHTNRHRPQVPIIDPPQATPSPSVVYQYYTSADRTSEDKEIELYREVPCDLLRFDCFRYAIVKQVFRAEFSDDADTTLGHISTKANRQGPEVKGQGQRRLLKKDRDIHYGFLCPTSSTSFTTSSCKPSYENSQPTDQIHTKTLNLLYIGSSHLAYYSVKGREKRSDLAVSHSLGGEERDERGIFHRRIRNTSLGKRPGKDIPWTPKSSLEERNGSRPTAPSTLLPRTMRSQALRHPRFTSQVARKDSEGIPSTRRMVGDHLEDTIVRALQVLLNLCFTDFKLYGSGCEDTLTKMAENYRLRGFDTTTQLLVLDICGRNNRRIAGIEWNVSNLAGKRAGEGRYYRTERIHFK